MQPVENQTSVTEFILLGFRDFPELWILLFLIFLLVYIVTMAGNLIIIVLVVTDQHLHIPMYFFLGILSCLETAYSSTILPRMLTSFVTGDITISFNGCLVQYYFFVFLAAVECCLLSVMSYDRYLAICKPLHYAALMNGKLCLQLAAGSWIMGFLASNISTALVSRLVFCGPNEIDHFLCEGLAIIELACSDIHVLNIAFFILASIFTVPPFLLTLTSYICIIVTILQIPSTTGRQRAFSTCSSHLTVVTIFYGALMIVYVLPNTQTLRDLRRAFSVFYTILTPMVNPLIYSLRNREVKEAVRRQVNLAFGRAQERKWKL
uniref:Olfactory receptor n=1 Tax=Sphenodon punctatus TaxID=8508 RepID=A0A8D0G918_SPHPU